MLYPAYCQKWVAKQGAFVFCYPVRTKVQPYQRNFLEQSLWYKFDFDGNEIAFYRWGHGPKKMLLVHGWISHSFRWRKYINHFDLDKYTIYAVDAPGHGLSSGNQLNLPIYGNLLHHVLMELNGVDVLMGHSFGGFNCLYTLFEYENPHVDKIILLASPGNAEDFVSHYVGLMKLNSRVTDLMLDYFKQNLGYELSYFSAPRFAKEMTSKGLIIHDWEDKDTDPKYAQLIHESWDDSELVMTNGFGHRLNQPEIIQIILDFIRESGEKPDIDEKVTSLTKLPKAKFKNEQLANSNA